MFPDFKKTFPENREMFPDFWETFPKTVLIPMKSLLVQGKYYQMRV